MPNNNTVFVDTSAWGHFLDGKQPMHQAFAREVTRINKRKGKLLTTNYIMNELVVLLETRSRLGRKQLLQVVNRIIASPFVEMIHIDEATH